MTNIKDVTIATHAGFCFGVKRAVEMTERSLVKKKCPVYIIGSLVHNDQVMSLLQARGLVKVDGIDDVPTGSVLIIRSHGVAKEIIDKAKEKNIEIIDTTCPYVRKARLAAEDFYKKGHDVVICGDANHSEIIGINSWIDNKGIIVGGVTEVDANKFKKDTIGVLSQTTNKAVFLQEIVDELSKNSDKKIIVENTICSDSTTKQNEIKELAKEVDVIIVVGGKSSSNTNKLAEIGRSEGTKTYHIETQAELDPEWFVNVSKIGIAAGASTAQFLINDVVEKINSF